MTFTQNKPDLTKISRGQYQIVGGKLQELVLCIQHRKIGSVEPFCREMWQEVELDGFASGDRGLSFELVDGPICLLSWSDCRRMMYRYKTYFVDENGFVCANIDIFQNDRVLYSRAYVLVDRHRVRFV